ncbi:MAG TPA: aminotransferase class III-fold pyridoxal phosphate-dependent enzyme [Anaerolineaceae bacterium]|jgi:taurine--2-oxoglutarate transaminase|nr:aminotransferase class III-fold pyridoxal phosphate-dependent enzyme [Anaerolineaceae bacterium]HNR00960.1 aminotransferase class III-fold pyridoxal phosphate-dependent enzyme [Anaerolineaceae bacterium]HNS06523.1 aminotransferase class III-fold pyridoxal phosphate-dependent enzyme [Anaerolineaceae bacterium]HOE02215.1 aminotransferase class III-fold pyridoxal phosphate-dependent enzyme [Anaerolineaceae bacterium]HQF69227.1 aminotransferase class III-fold pyridoxal phosphate-dependent enzyme
MIEMADADILPYSLEHNFWTWSAQAKVKPIPIKSAKGVYFWDVNGKKYLDLNSMVMCANIGHGDERVIQAMIDQARELPFAGPQFATKPRAMLGKKLAEILPEGLTKYLYTLGGADANENAVKLARAYTGRHKILTRYRSYHGATFGAAALTGDPRRTAWEPAVMPGVVHFLDPFRYRSTFHQRYPDVDEDEFSRDYLGHLEEIIQYEGPQTIAAILIESVTGTNGIIVPPEGYIQGVRDICNRHHILMIADEVMSGFGRTGEWFAVNHWGVVPDIMTMAKGLTSGYAPLGVVAMKPEIAAAFNEKVYEGGLTYNGHPISLAAAIAVIEVMQQDRLVEKAKLSGEILKNMLQNLKARHPSVGDVRSIGLFAAIEVVKNQQTKEPAAPFGGSSPEMSALRQYLLDHGVYLYTHWNTILIIPPLIITQSELEQGLSVIDQSLYEMDKVVNH